MMSVKLAIPGLLQLKILWNKCPEFKPLGLSAPPKKAVFMNTL